MTLSEIRQILAESDIRLTKSLGQNFLHDGNQLRRIIEAAELKPGDRVLEVGPGLGPLTELLLQNTGEVFAIEKDTRLAKVLRQRFGMQQRLELVIGDALRYFRENARDWSGWKLVSNLPYSVASPILVELAQVERGPNRMVVTLQMEVAKRLMAKPGEKDYGVLTLLVGLNYEAQKCFKIPASCFFPEPDVASGCVVLARRPQSLRDDEERETFKNIVKQGFSQRRKMMLKLLKEQWPRKLLEESFAELSLPIDSRAETISIEQFVRLARLLRADQKP